MVLRYALIMGLGIFFNWSAHSAMQHAIGDTLTRGVRASINRGSGLISFFRKFPSLFPARSLKASSLPHSTLQAETSTAHSLGKPLSYSQDNSNHQDEKFVWAKTLWPGLLVPLGVGLTLLANDNDDPVSKTKIYYKRLADKGNPEAQYSYALLCLASKKEALARRYSQLAAEQGIISAADLYSHLCYEGKGGKKDIREAKKYAKFAADKGIPESALIYAFACVTEGGAQNFREAKKYLDMAGMSKKAPA